MEAIPDGTPVLFERDADSARVGILIYTETGPACVPMGEHLHRGLFVPLALDAVVPLLPVQPDLPKREERDPFGPVLEIQAGTILAERVPGDPTRYKFFEVVEDLIHPFDGYDPKTPARVRDFEINSGPHGGVLDLPHQGTLPVRALAGLAQLQYHAVPDRFLHVLRIPIITEWEVENVAATGTFPTKTLAGPASVTYRDGRVTATLQSPERLVFVGEPSGVNVSDAYEKLKDGGIVPTSSSTPAWSATGVRYAGASMGWPDALFRFRVPRLSVTFADGQVTATRETFRGLTLNGFSHRIVLEYPGILDLMTARDAYIVEIFGRDARIVQSAANHVSIIHEGPPLLPDEIGDVLCLLQYFCGNRGEHISTETFMDTGRLSFDYHERGTSTERGVPPLRIDPWTKTPELIAREFSKMLACLGTLRLKAPVKLNAAFHHYFEGANSSYPVSRILMLAVAIDTLVALQTGNQRQARIISNDVFQRILKPIHAATLSALQSEGIIDPDATKILNKLNGLNNASARQRQVDFWADLGIVLTEEEIEVLETRHEVVHEGHVGSERTSEALWDNYRRSGVLANLFNRAMLTLLGWSGLYLDATEPGEQIELLLRPLVDGAAGEQTPAMPTE
jgi:hypothetical protein